MGSLSLLSSPPPPHLTDRETQRFRGAVWCPQLWGGARLAFQLSGCLAENYCFLGLPCESRSSTWFRLWHTVTPVIDRTACITLCLSALGFQFSWAVKTLCSKCRLQALVKAATGLLGFLGNTGHRDKYTNTNTRIVQRNKRQFIRELRCHHGKIVEGRLPRPLTCCVTSGKLNNFSGLDFPQLVKGGG